MTLFSMDMKTLTFALLLIIVITFIFLDIGISSSESAANSNVGSYSSGMVPDQIPEPICIFVERKGIQDEALSVKISDALKDKGFDVIVAKELQVRYPAQTLFISVTEYNGFYTPFYADSKVDVLFVYSSSGSSEYFEKFRNSKDTVPVVFASEDTNGYQLLMQGSIDILDTTRGLFSIRHHERHINELIAEEVVKSVQSQF